MVVGIDRVADGVTAGNDYVSAADLGLGDQPEPFECGDGDRAGRGVGCVGVGILCGGGDRRGAGSDAGDSAGGGDGRNGGVAALPGHGIGGSIGGGGRRGKRHRFTLGNGGRRGSDRYARQFNGSGGGVVDRYADVLQRGGSAGGRVEHAVLGLYRNEAAGVDGRRGGARVNDGGEQLIRGSDVVVCGGIVTVVHSEAVAGFVIVGYHAYEEIAPDRIESPARAVRQRRVGVGDGRARAFIDYLLIDGGAAVSRIQILREEHYLRIPRKDIGIVVVPSSERAALVEVEGGIVSILLGGICKLVGGEGMVMPALNAVEEAAAGEAELLGGAGERLIEPGMHAARHGVIDEVLEFVNEGAVGILYAVVGGAGGIRIGDAGIGVDMDYGQVVVGEVCGPEITRDVALTGLPAVVYIIEQYVYLAVVVAVLEIAVGIGHKIELRIEVVRRLLGVGGVDLIKGIVGGIRNGPYAAVLTDVEHLELHRALRTGGAVIVKVEVLGIAYAPGGPFGLGLRYLHRGGVIHQLRIDVDYVGTGVVMPVSVAAGGNALRGGDARFDKPGKRARRSAGGGA